MVAGNRRVKWRLGRQDKVGLGIARLCGGWEWQGQVGWDWQSLVGIQNGRIRWETGNGRVCWRVGITGLSECWEYQG